MRKIFLYILTLLSLNLTAQNDTWLNLQIQFDNYPEEVDWKLFQLDTLSSNNILVEEEDLTIQHLIRHLSIYLFLI